MMQMSFLNKDIFRNIAILGIVILAALLFIKLIPVIIIGGLAIWGVSKISKMKKVKKKDPIDDFSKEDTTFNSDKDTIIDVDYTEVRR
ncbi:hypothetical protein NL50_08110 [Clostridium acetobutylicum]|nr:hypothetical protein NL50_08110 [Clostridium acetobutylicum]